MTPDEVEYIQQCAHKFINSAKSVFTEIGKAFRCAGDAMVKMFEGVDLRKVQTVEAMATACRQNTKSCKQCEHYRGECRLPTTQLCSTDDDIISDCDAIYDAVLAPILREVDYQKAECENIRQTYVPRDTVNALIASARKRGIYECAERISDEWKVAVIDDNDISRIAAELLGGAV